MINPTVGRVVWYSPGAHELNMASDQPLASIITYVHADGRINLAVFGKGGDCHHRGSVPLWNGEGDAPEERLSYAAWPASPPDEPVESPPTPPVDDPDIDPVDTSVPVLPAPTVAPVDPAPVPGSE